jgi:ketosteroid isomerase-like protein
MVTTEARTATDVVRAYFDALQQGQFDLLGALFADDVRWHQPGQGTLSGVYTGKAAVFELFGKFMQLSGGTFAIDRSGGNDHGERGICRGSAPFSRASRH